MSQADFLLVCDPDDVKRVGIDAPRFRESGASVLIAPYDSLADSSLLRNEVKTHRAKALIFTQNDEGPKRPDIGGLLRTLRVGYSCASGIDTSCYDDQTKACLEDLLGGRGEVDCPSPKICDPDIARSRGTFSLIFDLEQLGGARFGVPRLLPFLEARGIRAVFFITGIIQSLYPGLITRIADGGHEIGVHGALHEFLQGKSLQEQTAAVMRQAEELRHYGPVSGANFIFRMDGRSPAAFSFAGLKYFTLFRKHLFHRTRFLPQSSRPRIVFSHGRSIPFFPIGAETYEYPFEEIKGMVESAAKTARLEEVRHTSCLMHPFKDGALQYWDRTRRVVDLLIEKLRLTPVPLASLPIVSISAPDHHEARTVRMRYRWDGLEPGEGRPDAAKSFTRRWWAPVTYHAGRIEALHDALGDIKGINPQLVGADDPDDLAASIYPDVLEGGGVVTVDPLISPERAAHALATHCLAGASATIAPPGPTRDALHYVVWHAPRTLNDVRVLLARICQKLTSLFAGRGRPR